MLTFVMLWAYFSFSQFMIIWAGNLREEIPWYLRRTQNGWQWLAVALIAIHFFFPFALLLSRRVKRSMTALSWIAIGVAIMTLADLYWLIEPAFSAAKLRMHWPVIAAVVGIGGIWISILTTELKRRPPLSLMDPSLVPNLERQ